MTPAIVVGSAPCFREDLSAALDKFPFAYVITVNGACAVVESADAMVAGHTNKAEVFVKARRKAFPSAKPIEVFANWARPGREPKDLYPSVTRWFDGTMSTGATSAAKAIRMALQIGYEPVILAGCPLDSSGYFPGETLTGGKHDCRRVGDPEQNAHRTIIGYREKFKKLADTEFKGRVFSMSGLTKQFLGAP